MTSRLAANLPLFRANLCPLTFLDVPEQAYSRATLGVYEMTRVELLRDLPELEPMACIQRAVAERVTTNEQAGVQALTVEQLRRLHEGVLARYGLRPSEYTAWKAMHGH